MTELRGPVGTDPDRQVLVLKGVEKHFGAVVAVAGIDLVLGGPGIIGLVGPNGSGKSTLFNVIAGTLKPTAGTVCWEGRDITGWRPSRIARTGLARTFQHTMAFGGLSVRKNLQIALDAGRGSSEAGALIERFELVGFEESLADDLPFGVARQLGIALAMATEPSMLLLDEPAAGLNAVESARVGSQLQSIAESGVSVVLVDHDMSFLMPLSYRVVVLNQGEVLADGVPDEVAVDPAVIDVYLGAAHADR